MGIRNTKLVKYRDEVKAAYEAGNTMQAIAELYNTSVGTVRNELVTQGVKIRRRGRRKNVVTEDEAKPEFKVSSLDEQAVSDDSVPVVVVPETPVDELPVERSEPVEGNEAVNSEETLRVIFGDN